MKSTMKTWLVGEATKPIVQLKNVKRYLFLRSEVGSFLMYEVFFQNDKKSKVKFWQLF